MSEEAGSSWIRCERLGGMPTGSRLRIEVAEQELTALGPGMVKHVRIEGIDGLEFMRFSDAHPGEDHLFKVGERTLKIPWDEFRLGGRRSFPANDVDRQ